MAVMCNVKLSVSGGDLQDHLLWQKVEDKEKEREKGGENTAFCQHLTLALVSHHPIITYFAIETHLEIVTQSTIINPVIQTLCNMLLIHKGSIPMARSH